MDGMRSNAADRAGCHGLACSMASDASLPLTVSGYIDPLTISP